MPVTSSQLNTVIKSTRNILFLVKMKLWIFLIVLVVLIIMLVLAWRKETIEQDIKWTGTVKVKRKAKKSRMPNTREEKCRDILESLTGLPFPTERPWWLTSPKTGRRLELDGYNEDLHVAFEYNGKQHYHYPNSYHKTREEFDKQIWRDEFKAEECRKRGVKLLVIPYNLEEDELYDFIKTKLTEKNVKVHEHNQK
jgi:hypothetical protein